MPKSINLHEKGLKDGRYILVSVDSDLVVKVNAVFVKGFHQEPYEDNGAIWMGYDIAPLDAEMKNPATEPKREVILFGQHVMNEVKKRFFPFEVRDYVWLTEFETLGGKAFFDWNKEACPEIKRDVHKPRLARGIIGNRPPA